MSRTLFVANYALDNVAHPSDIDAAKSNLFHLKTCQRNLLVSFDGPFSSCLPSSRYKEEDAYRFLLQTFCGLQSPLKGETEIVRQFKDAYLAYCNREDRDTRIIRLLEKLFMDGKKIRTNFLTNIGQLSYAGLSRKLLIERQVTGKIVITGAGQLTEDHLRIFSKNYSLVVCARNNEAIKKLAQKYTFETIAWENRLEINSCSIVINTLGIENKILWDENFFEAWKKANHNNALFVDLGTPSSIQTQLKESDGVYRLQDLLDLGKILGAEKDKKIQEALEAIEALIARRPWTKEAQHAHHMVESLAIHP